MEGSHDKVACTGRCPLSSPGYYSQLCELIVSVVKTAIFRLNLGNNNGGDKKPIFSLHFTQYPPVRFPLNDPALHSDVVMTLHSTCDADCLTAYREIVNILLEKQKRNIIEDELLLWCALSICDFETLSNVLKLARSSLVPTPNCILTSLLLRAIELFSDKGVEILLENGASPKIGLSIKAIDRPLKKALESAEDDNLSEDEDIRLAKIVENLVKFGANLLKPIDRHSDDIPLHKTTCFVLRSVDLAKTIVESTPGIGFKTAAFFTSRNIPYSPLACTIRDMAGLSFPSSKLGQIVMFAILPLLRGGSWLVPDPFGDKWIDGCLVTFLQQPDLSPIFLDLILAGRQKSSINLSRFGDKLMKFAPFLPADEIDSLLEKVRNRFPLKLQSICRVTILRHLSAFGISERQAAIGKLNLPLSLLDYLNFAEFEVWLP